MEKQRRLVNQALEVRSLAYAPYSNYQVGAALACTSGKVYTGCNVENASYGATVCAERVALFKAVSEGEREFSAMAVVTSGDEIASPCGICRQVLYEFAPDLTMYLANAQVSEVDKVSVKDLLPRPFGPAHLGEGCQ